MDVGSMIKEGSMNINSNNGSEILNTLPLDPQNYYKYVSEKYSA